MLRSMSLFLGYRVLTVDAGTPASGVRQVLREALSAEGWHATDAPDGALILKPGVGETVGNAVGTDVLLLNVQPGRVTIQSGVQTGAGVQALPLTRHEMTCDCTLGCALFLSMFSRSFLLGCETNAGAFGPLVASWAEGAQAPAGCLPVELLTGNLEREPSGPALTSASAAFTVGHGYGVLNGSTTAARALYPGAPAPASLSDVVNVCVVDTYHTSMRDGLAGEPLIGLAHRLARLSLPFALGSLTTPPVAGLHVEFDGTLLATASVPPMSFGDVTCAMGLAPATGRYAVSEVESDTILTVPFEEYSSTLTVSSALNWPQSGTVRVGESLIRYATRQGNVLSGLERGVLGTPAPAMDIGTRTRLCQWHLRWNHGMLLIGSDHLTGDTNAT